MIHAGTPAVIAIWDSRRAICSHLREPWCALPRPPHMACSPMASPWCRAVSNTVCFWTSVATPLEQLIRADCRIIATPLRDYPSGLGCPVAHLAACDRRNPDIEIVANVAHPDPPAVCQASEEYPNRPLYRDFGRDRGSRRRRVASNTRRAGASNKRGKLQSRAGESLAEKPLR